MPKDIHNLLSELSLKGIVQPDLITVLVNTNIYPIYYQFLAFNYKAGEILKGELRIENNIKPGSLVLASGLGHVIVENITTGKAYFKNSNEYRDIRSLHPLNFESVVFIPDIKNF